jgi:hypothetical protein
MRFFDMQMKFIPNGSRIGQVRAEAPHAHNLCVPMILAERLDTRLRKLGNGVQRAAITPAR